MAAIPVTIVGTITHADGSVEGVKLEGSASLTGLGVGGGPVQPPLGIWPPGSGIDLPTHPIAPGGPPPGIWPSPGVPTHPIAPGGPPPKPTFPIWGPPGISLPPGSGYPPVAGHPLPPDQAKPEPIAGWEAKTAWTPETGWVVVIVPKEGTEVPTPSA
jgi:hypothetical protein